MPQKPFKFFLVFIHIVILFSTPVLQAETKRPTRNIDKQLKRIERKIIHSRDMILADDYARLKSESDSTLKKLRELTFVFAPLGKHLEMILEEEKRIMEDTRLLHLNVSKGKKGVDTLVKAQNSNSDKLVGAITKVLKNGQQRNKKLGKNQQSLVPLLSKALKEQKNAEITLKKEKFLNATKSQAKAIQLLEKALKLLQKEKTEKPKKKESEKTEKLKKKASDNLDSKNKKDSKQGEKKESQKKDQAGDNKHQNEVDPVKREMGSKKRSKMPSSTGQEKKGSPQGEALPPHRDKKMDSKGARKELMRLQQKYDREKKERELRFGIIQKRSIQVEKDW